VQSQRPEWMADAVIADIRRAETHDIDDEPHGLFRSCRGCVQRPT
jgi:hypothetical protein